MTLPGLAYNGLFATRLVAARRLEVDRAAIQIGGGRHDLGNYDAQEVVALADVGRVSRQAQEARLKRAVHVVELIGSNPVVVGDAIVGQINKQLLQGSIVVGQRIGRRGIVAAGECQGPGWQRHCGLAWQSGFSQWLQPNGDAIAGLCGANAGGRCAGSVFLHCRCP